MTERTIRNVNIAVVVVLAIAIVLMGFFAPRASAAELVDRDPPTHRLKVCQPGKECEWRGRAKAQTACDLDLASDRLQAGLPSGTHLMCVPLVRR